jgi:hypothetical protein
MKWGFCGSTEIDNKKFKMQGFSTKNEFERNTSLSGLNLKVKLEIHKATKMIE